MAWATCENCDVSFHRNRDWQRFCGERCRIAYFKEHRVMEFKGAKHWKLDYDTGELHWIGPGQSIPCYYCGVPSGTIDHAVPRNVLARAATVDEIAAEIETHRVRIVPACRECNCQLLRGDHFNNMAERKAAAKRRIREKYRKLLTMPRWSDDEISELGDNLARFVAASLEWRDWVQARLAW